MPAKQPVVDLASWPSLQLEGGLIAPAMVARIAAPKNDEETRASYKIRKGLTIREEITTAYRVGQSHFNAFKQRPNPSAQATRRFARDFLAETFGFDDLADAEAPVAFVAGSRVPVVEDRGPVVVGRVPVVVVPPAEEKLDTRSATLSVDRFLSPASALQDYLNDREEALWGLVTNGTQIRLMRDNASLTRPAYIEANLEHIFVNEDVASFTALWLLIHRTRFGASGAPATDCDLERWRDAGAREGEVARDRLADQVKIALKTLGSGFLEANPDLAAQLKSGDVDLTEWFNELLRLVYRLIFLMVAEDRDLLHAASAGADARKLYAEGYSLAHLRAQCIRRATWNKHHDRYEALKIVFGALADGQLKLGLPALGGLFSAGQLPRLATARLRNRALMGAIYRLSFMPAKTAPVRVNWRAMETEELGSVYETLLELQPQIDPNGRTLVFASDLAETRGNQRKTTGSYYTPDSLVQALLDSALDPVLDETEAAADDPAEALLGLSVIDPACGSGHFLLAAARRIATRVARHRAEGTPSAADYRHALRDVARRCIHGVDRNPMAVELTKVALWIETVDPGLPLGFLDAQIRCGDALLGLFDLAALEEGIPDAAYKSLAGDDKPTANYCRKANKDAKAGQAQMDFETGQVAMSPIRPLAANFSNFRDLPEETVEQIGAKAQRFEDLQASRGFNRPQTAADLYVAAFLLPKTGGKPAGPSLRTVPTTEELWIALTQEQPPSEMVDALQAARSARAFHWPLEFPDVMQRGGFDAVLGNPPWEKFTLLEREFFADIPEIAAEANAAKRRRAIKAAWKALPALERRWNAAQRVAFAKRQFARSSNRFPQSAVGELNLYPLFAELALSLVTTSGSIGLIIKSLMFTGSTWKKFTDQLVTSGTLHSVFDFKNTETLFSSVGSCERFSLATMGHPRPASRLHLAVGLTNPAQITDRQCIIAVDREFPRRVNPQTGTLPQCETPDDLRILSLAADRLSTLGQSDWNARYTRGLDMTADASELRTREALEEEGFELSGSWFVRGAEQYAPVYEGKLIHQYDHRFATFNGIPVEKRFGIKARTINPQEGDKVRPSFEIIPRYWVRRQFFENNTRTRNINADWNFSFRDTTNVISNFRTAVACIVGPTAFNYKCPNVIIDEGDPVATALFLSMFNSVPYDYLVRQKFYGANFTKSLLLQTFVVSKERVQKYETGLLDAVVSLTNMSNSVKAFCDSLGRVNLSANDLRRRLELRAWIDSVHCKLFGFDVEETEYIFETFSIWKARSTAQWGCFLEKDRALDLLAQDESAPER